MSTFESVIFLVMLLLSYFGIGRIIEMQNRKKTIERLDKDIQYLQFTFLPDVSENREKYKQTYCLANSTKS